jgi:hypothetical protein
LSAAEEPDPFASIRGDFDLSAQDTRQWKTSLKLQDAERCGLIKTPSAAPNSQSAWTFGCLFHGDGYERIVTSVQSVLNLQRGRLKFSPTLRPAEGWWVQNAIS